MWALPAVHSRPNLSQAGRFFQGARMKLTKVIVLAPLPRTMTCTS